MEAPLSDIPKLLQNMGANGSQAYSGSGGMAKAIGALASSIAATGVSDATNVATYLLRKTLNSLLSIYIFKSIRVITKFIFSID